MRKIPSQDFKGEGNVLMVENTVENCVERKVHRLVSSEGQALP